MSMEVTPWRVISSETILAVGGHLKARFAIATDGVVRQSRVFGDLGDAAVREDYADAVLAAVARLSLRPTVVVCDMHPDYASVRLAEQWSCAWNARLVRVQHHHAHLASVLLENDRVELVTGVVLDGTGYGTDGTIWGGEFLIGDRARSTRVARLRPAALPGGEAAIRAPWRLALARVIDAGLDPASALERIPSSERAAVRRLIERGVNSPLSSSAGRLFDAAASIVMAIDLATGEAEAAIALQALAESAPVDADSSFFPFTHEPGDPSQAGSPITIDTRPLIRELVASRGSLSQEVIALRFHATIAAMIETTVEKLVATGASETVALTGGVFANRLLTKLTTERLLRRGFRVITHDRIPGGDAGLSLGQLASIQEGGEGV